MVQIHGQVAQGTPVLSALPPHAANGPPIRAGGGAFRGARRPARRPPRPAAGLAGLLILLAGCTQPPPERRPPGTPPVFFDEGGWKDERLLGKSIDQVRVLMRGAIETPVTLRVRSEPLQTVVRQLSQETGLGIGITPEVTRAARGRPISLSVRGVPARRVLDWLTRLVGAYYALEGPQTVFITRDRDWASQARLRMRSYAVGTFFFAGRPKPGPYDHLQEAQKLAEVLRYALRHTMRGHRDANLLLDETGSRLTASLPARGHAKLEQIIQELKKPRRYVPPEPAGFIDESARVLQTPLLGNVVRQDVRDLADEIGKRAKVNIGFDYELVPKDRRQVGLALGRTTLGKALAELARAAHLGRVIMEEGRLVWILGPHQDRGLLRATGELPWDRAVVRSHYVRPIVDLHGVKMLFDDIRSHVTPGTWDGDLPVAFYQKPTGRLVVVHDPAAQRQVAQRVRRMMTRVRPKRPPRE